MIVITREYLKFLKAGRTLTIPDSSGRYRQGRDYALGLDHWHQLCRVEVLEVSETTIKVKLTHREQPRFLARSPGTQRTDYVNRPENGIRGEPEAPSSFDTERIANEARAHWQAEINAFKGEIQQRAEQLADGAPRADKRRLRNLSRMAKGL